MERIEFHVGPNTTAEEAIEACRLGRRLVIEAGAPEWIVSKLLQTWVAPCVADIWEDRREAKMLDGGHEYVPKRTICINVPAKLKHTSAVLGLSPVPSRMLDRFRGRMIE